MCGRCTGQACMGATESFIDQTSVNRAGGGGWRAGLEFGGVCGGFETIFSLYNSITTKFEQKLEGQKPIPFPIPNQAIPNQQIRTDTLHTCPNLPNLPL